MRIQETDQILKDARYARRHNEAGGQTVDSFATRTWKMISSVPGRVTSLFKHKG